MLLAVFSLQGLGYFTNLLDRVAGRNSNQLPFQAQLDNVLDEVRDVSDELDSRLKSTSSKLQTRLRLLETDRNLKSSDSIMLLSSVATFYLPLGLSASLLSMSTRLADFVYMLYDFVALAFVQLTMTVGLAAVIQILMPAYRALLDVPFVGFIIVIPWGVVSTSGRNTTRASR
ncbi:hypothetical protein BJY01DRAFT_241846 [Aspergillus pseudoustus]|uniref:Uncharacterized protein n=1 Tax=Aspergillus pseudoustus TaxID=1810923 RepID=A0ABR4L1W9_9EURO